MDTAGYEEAPQAIEEPVTANGGKSHGKKKGLAASGFQRGMVGVKAGRTCCSGFCEFLMQGNIIQLAIAFVIGIAFQAVVNALVTDIITPLISAIWGGQQFADLYFTVHHSRFLYGDFANKCLTFLIICLILYFLVILPMTALLNKYFPKAPVRECPECLSEINAKATRCKYCTIAVPPVQVVVDDIKQVPDRDVV